MPGGVDGHCHLDQPTSDGSVCADDFYTGTVAAAFGGTTTVLPFACQFRGRPMQEAVDDYHRRAHGKAVIDYAFHLIVSDPTEALLKVDLPRLIGEGYTSFKIYMTYDDMKLNDKQIVQLLSLARSNGAMAMIHAENADLISWLTDTRWTGKTAPRFHATARRCCRTRGPTVRHDRRTGRRAILTCMSRAARRSIRSTGRRAANAHLRRDLPAVRRADAGRSGAAGIRRRQVHLQPATTKQGQPGRDLGRLASGCSTSSLRTTRFSLPVGQGQDAARPPDPFNWVPNGVPGIETRCRSCFPRA